MAKNYHIIPLVVLIIALIAETYYVVNLKSNPKPQQANLNNINSPSNITTNQNSRDISIGFILYLNKFNKKILKSSMLNNEYKGTLTRILSTPAKQSNVQYERGVFIKPINDNYGNYLLFTPNDMKKIKIYDKKKNTIVNFGDLKVGDNIEIKETMDLFGKYPDTRESIEIDIL